MSGAQVAVQWAPAHMRGTTPWVLLSEGGEVIGAGVGRAPRRHGALQLPAPPPDVMPAREAREGVRLCAGGMVWVAIGKRWILVQAPARDATVWVWADTGQALWSRSIPLGVSEGGGGEVRGWEGDAKALAAEVAKAGGTLLPWGLRAGAWVRIERRALVPSGE